MSGVWLRMMSVCMGMCEVVCEHRSDRHGLAVVGDGVFRIERLDSKGRRQLVLRKPVQDDDVDCVVDKDRRARADTRNVEQGAGHAQ